MSLIYINFLYFVLRRHNKSTWRLFLFLSLFSTRGNQRHTTRWYIPRKDARLKKAFETHFANEFETSSSERVWDAFPVPFGTRFSCSERVVYTIRYWFFLTFNAITNADSSYLYTILYSRKRKKMTSMSSSNQRRAWGAAAIVVTMAAQPRQVFLEIWWKCMNLNTNSMFVNTTFRDSTNLTD